MIVFIWLMQPLKMRTGNHVSRSKPSINYTAYPFEEPIQLTLRKKWVTTWTGHQSIIGLAYTVETNNLSRSHPHLWATYSHRSHYMSLNFERKPAQEECETSTQTDPGPQPSCRESTATQCIRDILKLKCINESKFDI